MQQPETPEARLSKRYPMFVRQDDAGSSPNTSQSSSRWRRWAARTAATVAAVMLALPGQGLAQAPQAAASNAATQAVQDHLRQKAAANGEVAVIVGLALPRPFTAEGKLPARVQPGLHRGGCCTRSLRAGSAKSHRKSAAHVIEQRELHRL